MLTSQEEECLYVGEGAACLFVPHSNAYRRVAFYLKLSTGTSNIIVLRTTNNLIYGIYTESHINRLKASPTTSSHICPDLPFAVQEVAVVSPGEPH